MEGKDRQQTGDREKTQKRNPCGKGNRKEIIVIHEFVKSSRNGADRQTEAGRDSWASKEYVRLVVAGLDRTGHMRVRDDTGGDQMIGRNLAGQGSVDN